MSAEIQCILVYIDIWYTLPDTCKSTLGWDPHAHKLLPSRTPGPLNSHVSVLHWALWWMMMVGRCKILQQALSNTKSSSKLCATTAKEKRNPVQEYTDWSIVPMKGQVIIYFSLVFKFHQPKFHLPMQLSHFKKNCQESIKQYQEEKEVR